MVAMRIVKLAAVGALVIGLGSSLAYASADDAIKGRQGCMKGHLKMMGDLFKMYKGESPYDSAAVQAAIAEMDASCADWSKWWGADTQKGETLETWAKPEIWTDPKGFEAAGGAYYEKYLAVKATTDEAGFKAALPAWADTCKGCHEKFRRPKN